MTRNDCWAAGLVVLMFAVLAIILLQPKEPERADPFTLLTQSGWVAQPGIGGNYVLHKLNVQVDITQVCNQHKDRFEDMKGVLHVLKGFSSPKVGRTISERNVLQIGEVTIRGSSSDLAEVRGILTK